jgi:hypothetical protein
MPHSSRLLVPHSLQAYTHFFFPRTVFVTSIIVLAFFPMANSNGDYSPTAPAVPSLRPLVPSGSMIWYETVKMYHHLPQFRVRLDSVYHRIYLREYLALAIPYGLKFRRFPLRACWSIKPHIFALVVAREIHQSVVKSIHQVTGQLQMLAGIISDVV